MAVRGIARSTSPTNPPVSRRWRLSKLADDVLSEPYCHVDGGDATVSQVHQARLCFRKAIPSNGIRPY